VILKERELVKYHKSPQKREIVQVTKKTRRMEISCFLLSRSSCGLGLENKKTTARSCKTSIKTEGTYCLKPK